MKAVLEAARRTLLAPWLRARERRARVGLYRQIFAGVTEGIVVYEATAAGQDFIVRDINDAALRIRQVRREEAVDSHLSAFCPAETEASLGDGLRRVLATVGPERRAWQQPWEGRSAGWNEYLRYQLSRN